MPRNASRTPIRSPLERAIARALEARTVRVTRGLLTDLIRAFETAYELTPVRNVKRNGEVVTLEVRSRSNYNVWHRVRLNGTLSLDYSCTCEAYNYGVNCWHLRYAWKLVNFLTEAGLL